MHQKIPVFNFSTDQVNNYVHFLEVLKEVTPGL